MALLHCLEIAPLARNVRAQKPASSRHGFDAMTATRPGAGAFGKKPLPRDRGTARG